MQRDTQTWAKGTGTDPQSQPVQPKGTQASVAVLRVPLNVFFHYCPGQKVSAAYYYTLENSWWVKGTAVSLSGSTSWWKDSRGRLATLERETFAEKKKKKKWHFTPPLCSSARTDQTNSGGGGPEGALRWSGVQRREGRTLPWFRAPAPRNSPILEYWSVLFFCLFVFFSFFFFFFIS